MTRKTTKETVKEQIVRAMKALPDDATFGDAMDTVYVLYKIQQGLADSEAGRTISHEEMLKRIATWRT